MSSLYRNFQTDATKELEGVLVQYAPNEDASIPAFRIRRRGSSNQTYAKELKRQSEPFRRQIELNTLDEMVSRQILIKVFCRAILLGWENVQDSSNNPIPYSYDAAIKLFSELPELYDDLADQSGKLALFRNDVAEIEVKN